MDLIGSWYSYKNKDVASNQQKTNIEQVFDGHKFEPSDISSPQCYSVLSTIAQVLRKNEFENFSTLIFDVSFIIDLRIRPEG